MVVQVVVLNRVASLNIEFLDQSFVVVVKYYMVMDKLDFVGIIDYNHMIPLSKNKQEI
jgi:hypothetical protein